MAEDRRTDQHPHLHPAAGWNHVTGLTCTLGPGAERWSRVPCAAIQGPGEEHADLILSVRVQVSNLVRGLIDGCGVDQHAHRRAVLHL